MTSTLHVKEYKAWPFSSTSTLDIHVAFIVFQGFGTPLQQYNLQKTDALFSDLLMCLPLTVVGSKAVATVFDGKEKCDVCLGRGRPLLLCPAVITLQGLVGAL